MADTGVEGVTVVRAGTTVLRNVTLRAAEGEVLVVLGSSGSGTSTLLRVLAGLERVDSGSVVVRGRDVTRLPPGERRVSMVFESSALIPFLDVSRNLGWGLEVRRLPPSVVRDRVQGRARHLRLGRMLSRRPDQLSGGEQSLVGIGHALVADPDVYLLDEPLGDLDAVRRTEVRRQLIDVVRSRGAPAFYATHDPGEAMAVADRIALLHQGAVVQVGRPRDLYERPVNLTAADLLGSPPIGLLPARLVVSGGLAGFRVGRRTLPLWRPLPPPLTGHVDRVVVLGLRAEDVLAAPPEPDPDAVTVDAVVTDVRFCGRHDAVTMAVGTDPVPAPVVGPAGATLRCSFPPRAQVRPGDAVRVAVDVSRAHVFDAVTGDALWHPDGGHRPGAGDAARASGGATG